MGLRLLLVAAALLMPRLAWAQLFSPGPMSKAHAELDGLKDCTQCHPQGGKLEAALCFECHEPIQVRVRAERGFHGRMEEKRCEKCHPEHRGPDYPQIRWKPREFRHAEAGWPLKGAHEDVECRACHEKRLIVDRAVLEKLRAPSKTMSWLGLGTKCASCHFDEHRDQLSDDCARCHTEKAFAPAPGFDHGKADFVLRGAHRKVRCAECHPEERDKREGVFPAPKFAAFARYAPIEHEACTDCHIDPHQGRFGPDCTQCHTENRWSEIIEGAKRKRSFHDDTRYPLEGRHAKVGCDACHRPLGRSSKVFRGLKFGRCDDCHLDGHEGDVEGDCEGCHSVQGFYPADYSADDHQKVWPLERDHAATPCGGCHPSEPLPPWPAATRRALAARRRKPPRSEADLAPAGGRCLDCHEDAHAGQLGERCVDCHLDGSWAADRFEHAKARFALEGKHADAACVDCHRRSAPSAPVAYRPIERRCAGCHPDPHQGQFELREEDCDRCHGLDGFEIARFDHARTRYPLEGKHAEVECAGCHPSVKGPNGEALVKYRPLPIDCAGCHADFHRGGFRGYR